MPTSRSAKTLILASGQGLTTLVNLLTIVVLARLFSKVDYATYRQTMLAYLFAAPIVMLGLNSTLFYFLPRQKDRPRGVLTENLLLLAAGGVLLSLFLVAGGNRWLAERFHNPHLIGTLLILAPYPLLMFPAASLGACLLARGRAGQVAAYNVTSRAAMFLAVVIPALLWPWPATAVAGAVAAAAVSGVLALMLMFRACPPGGSGPTLAGCRNQLSYGVPLGLARLAGTIGRRLDTVMVSALCTPEIFAVYVNGAMEIPLIGVITGSVTSVLLVDYTTLYAQGRLAEIVGLIHRAMVKCALVLLPVMVFLLCTAPELMRFLFSDEYEASAVPFRVYLLLLPIRTLTFSAILMATGNNRHVLIQSVLTVLVQLALIWYLVGLLGAVGAALASVLATYLVAVPYLTIVIRRILKYPIHQLFPWSQMFQVAALSAAGALPALGLKTWMLGWSPPVVLAVTGTVYGALTLLLFCYFRFVRLSAVTARLRGMLSGRG